MTDTVPAVVLDDGDARLLGRIGKKVEQSTAERNDLIKRIHGNGGGIREIARAVGLSPATVHNIINGRKR